MNNRVVHAISQYLATSFHNSFVTLQQKGFWKLDIGLMIVNNCLSLVKRRSMFSMTTSSSS